MAVHPDDQRYQKYVGRKVLVPILGREIPVIADEYVDREFGTGALKVTPGHDPNDYADRRAPPPGVDLDAGRRRQRSTPTADLMPDWIVSMPARISGAIWRQPGLVIKEEPYHANVPRSQRGGEIIEPMISTQWFVHIKPLAEAALAAGP